MASGVVGSHNMEGSSQALLAAAPTNLMESHYISQLSYGWDNDVHFVIGVVGDAFVVVHINSICSRSGCL